MNKSEFEQKLSAQLASLPRDKQPDRDLWPGIERALVNTPQPVEKRNGGQKVYLLAASFAALGLIAWLSLPFKPSGLNEEDVVSLLASQHQAQKQALLVQFKDQPALTQNWQEQVDELDEAALAIKAALKNDPNNMALLRLLQNVYQQQISLIERVHSPKWSQI
ncbi:MAG: hypothetical protein GW763_10795 [Paraglaciecola sp.]|nr:hypothetical protein [Paraglaciecola sp.]NCT48455.1 hypothetical protein [Paraglaciecola sp.]